MSCLLHFTSLYNHTEMQLQLMRINYKPSTVYTVVCQKRTSEEIQTLNVVVAGI